MGNDSETFKDKLLLEIHKDVTVIRSDIAVVQVDLKEHMRRTAILEAQVKSHDRYIYMFHGALAVIGAVFTSLKYFFKII